MVLFLEESRGRGTTEGRDENLTKNRALPAGMIICLRLAHSLSIFWLHEPRNPPYCLSQSVLGFILFATNGILTIR